MTKTYELKKQQMNDFNKYDAEMVSKDGKKEIKVLLWKKTQVNIKKNCFYHKCGKPKHFMKN